MAPRNAPTFTVSSAQSHRHGSLRGRPRPCERVVSACKRRAIENRSTSAQARSRLMRPGDDFTAASVPVHRDLKDRSRNRVQCRYSSGGRFALVEVTRVHRTSPSDQIPWRRGSIRASEMPCKRSTMACWQPSSPAARQTGITPRSGSYRIRSSKRPAICSDTAIDLNVELLQPATRSSAPPG